MQDGFSTAKSLGKGLGGAKRLVARFEIESGPSGTIVRMASQ
jgi:serine/threonine-protein kinase RsbT